MNGEDNELDSKERSQDGAQSRSHGGVVFLHGLVKGKKDGRGSEKPHCHAQNDQ